jgi:hypothetical protein
MSSITQDNLPDLCLAVGYVTINWALMERQMNNCVHLVFSELGGVPGHEVKPTVFKAKASYLSKAFKHVKLLAPHKDTAFKLIAQAKTTSNTRHAFTHGTLECLENTVLTINKLQTKDAYRAEHFKFDLLDFPIFSIELGDLVKNWLTLSKNLLDEHKVRKAQLGRMG